MDYAMQDAAALKALRNGATFGTPARPSFLAELVVGSVLFSVAVPALFLLHSVLVVSFGA